MFNKKANFPLLKTLFILLTTTIIIIVYIIILHQMQTVSIDDKKTRTQIIETKILSDCFSDEFGTFEKEKITQNTLNNCIKENNNIFANIRFQKESLYIGKEEDFKLKEQFCQNSKSNVLCTKLKYPIVYKETDGEYKQSVLTLLIIAQ